MASNRTQEIRTAELIKQIKAHPDKEELLQLMFEQVADDTPAVRCELKSYQRDMRDDMLCDSAY